MVLFEILKQLDVLHCSRQPNNSVITSRREPAAYQPHHQLHFYGTQVLYSSPDFTQMMDTALNFGRSPPNKRPHTDSYSEFPPPWIQFCS
jgi:hypothetical protein